MTFNFLISARNTRMKKGILEIERKKFSLSSRKIRFLFKFPNERSCIIKRKIQKSTSLFFGKYQYSYKQQIRFSRILAWWLSSNVSNASEIIQGSLVGPISVHFRGSITYTGASGGLRSHILALFWNFE